MSSNELQKCEGNARFAPKTPANIHDDPINDAHGGSSFGASASKW